MTEELIPPTTETQIIPDLQDRIRKIQQSWGPKTELSRRAVKYENIQFIPKCCRMRRKGHDFERREIIENEG